MSNSRTVSISPKTKARASSSSSRTIGSIGPAEMCDASLSSGFGMNMSSLASMTTDAIILNQLITVVNEIFASRKRSLAEIISTLLAGMGKTLSVILVQFLVKNIDRFTGLWRWFLIRVLYTRLQLKNVSGTREFYLSRELNSEVSSPVEESRSSGEVMKYTYVGTLPVFFNTEGINSYCYYLPALQSGFMKEMEERAARQEEAVRMNRMTKMYRDLEGEYFTPAVMFPSRNYQRLERILDGFFSHSRMTKAQGIVINGRPGLGKTGSRDYLSSREKYGDVRYINLNAKGMAETDFDDLVTTIYDKCRFQVSTIVCIDEIDKYIFSRINHLYAEEVKECRRKKLEPAAFSEFQKSQKERFLSSFLDLIEVASFEKGVAFIFYANNIHTIYDGVDMIHFNSFRSRFVEIEFEMCDASEFGEYVRFYNTQKILEAETEPSSVRFVYSSERLEECIQRIDPLLSVTFRDVYHCQMHAEYDTEKWVERVNSLYSESQKETVDSLAESAESSKGSTESFDSVDLPPNSETRENEESVKELPTTAPLSMFFDDSQSEICEDSSDEGHSLSECPDEERSDGERSEENDEGRDLSEDEDLPKDTEKPKTKIVSLKIFNEIGICKMCTYHRSDHLTRNEKRGRSGMRDAYISVCSDEIPNEEIREICPSQPINIKELMGGMVRFLKLCENADGKLRKTMIVIDLFDYLSKRSAQLKGLLRTSPKFLQTLEVKLEDLSEDIRNLTHSSNRLTDLEGCSETPSDTPVQVYHKMEEMYHELWNLSAEEKLSVRSRYEESIIEPRNAIHEVRKYHLSKGIEV